MFTSTKPFSLCAMLTVVLAGVTYAQTSTKTSAAQDPVPVTQPTPKPSQPGVTTGQAPAKPSTVAPPTAVPPTTAAKPSTPLSGATTKDAQNVKNTAPVTLPPGYLIGADDVLTVVFWREKDLSSDVVVRPDGKISLPLLNDVDAGGLTPEQLRLSITELATKFVEAPTVSVVVKQINSRKVYITGAVSRPGTYTIAGPMNILQLIALAGGVSEFADKENVIVVSATQRDTKGQPLSYRINYADLVKRKNLQQNIELKPGDTVVVP